MSELDIGILALQGDVAENLHVYNGGDERAWH